MSKKNRKQDKDNGLTVRKVHLGDGTIQEQFQRYIQRNRSIDDIIVFLSLKNAELIALVGMGKITAKLKIELYEFYQYFMENFDDMTYSARMRNWGQEPYIFRLTEQLLDDDVTEMEQQYLDSLPENVKKEAKTLCDTLFAIREDREITYFTDKDRGMVEIPKTVYREDIEDYKQGLYLLCCNIIEDKGAMVVRLHKKDHDEVFGIRTLPIGIWSPVSKEDMLEAHCTAPDGTRLEPEEGTVFTEIMRERF